MWLSELCLKIAGLTAIAAVVGAVGTEPHVMQALAEDTILFTSAVSLVQFAL
jgi:hypothetical protein